MHEKEKAAGVCISAFYHIPINYEDKVVITRTLVMACQCTRLEKFCEYAPKNSVLPSSDSEASRILVARGGCSAAISAACPAAAVTRGSHYSLEVSLETKTTSKALGYRGAMCTCCH